MKTSPAPSTVNPRGQDSPVPTVVWAPPPAGPAAARLLKVSEMKTSPPPPPATPYGPFSPLPTVVWTPGPNAIAGPLPMPEIRLLATGLPEESLSCTAPMRNPGASGAKVTITMQLDGLPVQVVLASVKSRLGVPWVTTFTGLAPKVVPGGMLYCSVMG